MSASDIRFPNSPSIVERTAFSTSRCAGRLPWSNDESTSAIGLPSRASSSSVWRWQIGGLPVPLRRHRRRRPSTSS